MTSSTVYTLQLLQVFCLKCEAGTSPRFYFTTVQSDTYFIFLLLLLSFDNLLNLMLLVLLVEQQIDDSLADQVDTDFLVTQRAHGQFIDF